MASKRQKLLDLNSTLNLSAMRPWSDGALLASPLWHGCGGSAGGRTAQGLNASHREESASRVTNNAIITACIASIAAVVVALIQSSGQGGDPTSVALVILGVLGTIVAWALVNTVYALKYARMYFLDHPGDGFDVKQEPQPAYSDFAYFAFTAGMSYAAPETEPVNSDIRRKALLHALLSYFFGTVLIAVAINLVWGKGDVRV
ncbi:DUF1345 domain-containing protein [Arthrobacter crystallopoietes]|uniref:DUF1345 domain-containing protein n=1 Tax=Crystallibacter crystallopoietes TaxID=37928 RepID=UPI0011137EA2|nr:DUF1345 domain-containing protein [Arthrobacter crystallopoietes]